MHPKLQKAFEQRIALKIISGLNNFDVTHVSAVVKAAEAGGATFVDMAADPDLIRQIRQQTSLPICASAVVAETLAQAVAAGADLVEIGNFDCFYAQGRRFEAPEVLRLTQQTRSLLPEVTLSVTVPHLLPLDEQATLADALVKLGADIIQTEGGTSSQPTHAGVAGLIEKATPTLAAAHSIARAVNVPVLCASGLSDVTAPMAIATGAAGVGIGSAVNQLDSEVAMLAAVRRLVAALTPQSAAIWQ